MKKPALIPTESLNPRTAKLSSVSVSKMVSMINGEDFIAAQAVKKANKQISQAVETAAAAFMKGGNIIFAGAGTSGRLGVIEAAECPPTFGTEPQQIIGLMAGGKESVFKAQEGAEDNEQLGMQDIKAHAKKGDIVFGIAASGVTPYVFGVLKQAKKIKAHTVFITCNNKKTAPFADITIYLATGPEALQGSTRMKAGTATKMALNAITTGTMALCGKIYKNFMVDVNASNAKLKQRALRLVVTIAKTSESRAQKLLEEADYKVKTAIVMSVKNVSKTEAEKMLKAKKGFLKDIIDAKKTK